MSANTATIAKTVNAKAATGAKPQVRKATPVKAASKPAAKSGIKFVIKPTFRPGSGRNLASFTAAWIALSGMQNGATVPSALVRRIAGDTAFSHHKRLGNFEATPDGVKLTDQGEFHFSDLSTNRNIKTDPELVKAYMSVMSTGKPDGNVIKNPAGIEAA